MIEAGADVIAISDPSGTGEILGPKFFEEYAVKYLNMLLDGIESKQAGTIVHICGQMRSVYRQIDMVHAGALSFDAIVPMKEARAHLGDRVLMGNVSTFALEFANEDRIEKLTKFCVRSGSDIISPPCGLGTKSPLDALRTVRFVPGTATAVIHGKEVIQIEAGDTTNVLYGVAIDIGTTTVVCTLVDMLTGKELAHTSMINAQKHFGLDVLTRITYELEHERLFSSCLIFPEYSEVE